MRFALLSAALFAAICFAGHVSATLARAAGPAIESPEPLAPLEAARTMQVPPGFNVTLFAGEPDVQQPIGMCTDDRGRLWVAENYSYPKHTDKAASDRIIILEDTDHDGRFDKRTVFYDKLNYVTGVEVGFGGVWIMSPPFMMFIPDRNGDDKPDGEPTILLDGFGNHANSHNLANGFAWGPDGWLYCTHGRTNWSLIGKPGAPKENRTRFDGGVFRYHPTRHEWEPYCDGMTNPWGIDWNDYGQAFACNCVEPHLFQIIYGAHYEPWRNRESSQFAYQRIATIADHLHFIGAKGPQKNLGSHLDLDDDAGGGHAHCGALIYLGDNWPAAYRNTILMHNIHGRRINNDILKRAGSGYVGLHGADVMKSRDPWFVGVTLQAAPDGSVFSSDWSDTGECHHTRNTRRETGRIFKISYGTPAKPAIANLAEEADTKLVELHLHQNDWWVRHARRVLQERAAAGKNLADAKDLLRKMYAAQNDVTRKLRALWTLHTLDAADEAFLATALNEPNEYLRGWAVRLLMELPTRAAKVEAKLVALAQKDESALVRLELASGLQRYPNGQQVEIATALLAHAEDEADQNLPLMLWYTIEPLVNSDLPRFLQLAKSSQIPLVRRHIARRVAESAKPANRLDLLVKQISEISASEAQLDLLVGLNAGLAGKRRAAMPEGWPKLYETLAASDSPKVQAEALELALLFDDPTALASLRKKAADKKLGAAERNRALAALVARRVPDLPELLLTLAVEPETSAVAVRGLAEYDASQTAETLLQHYASYPASVRQDVLQTLASRRAWATALLDAVEAEKIPRADLTAFTARQLQSLGDEKLAARVTKLWGTVRTTPADKTKLIADYRKKLTPATLASADTSLGRAVFQKTCANCHTLFDAGGAIGPNLTGSQRTNLDYMLENIIDPSASVAKDFQVQVLSTDSGRTLTGIVVAENANAVTLQTQNEKLVIPLGEIDERTPSPLSMMPDGILTPLSFDEIRGLLAYLAAPQQVPLQKP
jgi:putative membrane-bound dehydrogenase-like protein